MKILDEKGRLFGKVNIIDLLVILLVIAAAVFLVLRQIGKEPVTDEVTNKTDLTYQVRVTGIDPVTYASIRQYVDASEGKSEQMYSSDNDTFLDAYLVDCVATPYLQYVATADGEVKAVQSSGDDERVDLVFTVEAKINDTNTNSVGSQQVRVGAGHYLKTVHFELYGSVISAVKGSD